MDHDSARQPHGGRDRSEPAPRALPPALVLVLVVLLAATAETALLLVLLG